MDEKVKDEEEKKDAVSEDEDKEPHAMDAAQLRKSIISDIARRDSLYTKVSPIIGSFDHTAMDSNDLARYSAKKLGLKCAKGQEISSIDSYLLGRKSAPKETATVKTDIFGIAQDGKRTKPSKLDLFLKEDE
jgi:hypothetical protein